MAKLFIMQPFHSPDTSPSLRLNILLNTLSLTPLAYVLPLRGDTKFRTFVNNGLAHSTNITVMFYVK